MFQENRMPAIAAKPGQQHQRQADAVRREVILDAERWNPGHFDHRDDSRIGIERDGARQRRRAKPASAVSKATMRAAPRAALRQEHQHQHAEEVKCKWSRQASARRILVVTVESCLR